MDPASLLEEIRFGYGPRLDHAPAPGGVDPDRVLAQLTAPDPEGARWDRPTLAERFVLIDRYNTEKKTAAGVQPDTSVLLKQTVRDDLESYFARPTFAAAGFVERLVNLWANRITISNVSGGVERVYPIASATTPSAPISPGATPTCCTRRCGIRACSST